MDRETFEAHVCEKYSVEAEHPFSDDLTTAVFRHTDNKKWFAIVMRIPRGKLGLSGEGKIDVVNFKCAQDLLYSLWEERGIFPAYHMNKNHWITVCLDGSVPDETVDWLLRISFGLTATKKRIKTKKE